MIYILLVRALIDELQIGIADMAVMIPAATGYSLWLRPYGDLAYKLNDIIKKYSKQFGTPSFEPHLTLLGGLQQSEASLISMTNLLAGRLHPFEINLTTVSYQNSFYQSMYAKAEKSDELMKAHITARRLFQDEDSADGFIPHVSLMYSHLDRNEKLKLINNNGKAFNESFEVHGVILIKTEGAPNEWEEIHSAQFDKS